MDPTILRVNSDQYYFENVSKALDIYSEHYEKFILTGDFNAEDKEPILNNFLYQYDAKNIVKDKTCFKSIENPSCIDLIITNSRNSFKNTTAISTGLSDFHKMVLTILKTKFEKAKPRKLYTGIIKSLIIYSSRKISKKIC